MSPLLLILFFIHKSSSSSFFSMSECFERSVKEEEVERTDYDFILVDSAVRRAEEAECVTRCARF